MQFERRLRSLSPKDTYFHQFSRDKTSQCGEDGILEEIFRLIDNADQDKEKSLDNIVYRKKRFCIDIGAWDGKHLSNTYSLLTERDWSGLLIEADPERHACLKSLYEDRQDITCLCSLVDISGEFSINKLFDDHNVPMEPDFLCIDIDGADYHLWSAAATSAQPRRALVVCIEFNPSIPHDIYFIQHPDVTVHQGSSILAIQELGEQLDYVLVAVTTFNAIFIRKDIVKAAIPSHISFPTQLERIHSPGMTTSIFQTYDGELKYAGVKKLLWHRLPLNTQKLQVLQQKDRKYPFAPPDLVKTNSSIISIEDIEAGEWATVERRLLQGLRQGATESDYFKTIEKTAFQIMSALKDRHADHYADRLLVLSARSCLVGDLLVSHGLSVRGSGDSEVSSCERALSVAIALLDKIFEEVVDYFNFHESSMAVLKATLESLSQAIVRLAQLHSSQDKNLQAVTLLRHYLCKFQTKLEPEYFSQAKLPKITKLIEIAETALMS